MPRFFNVLGPCMQVAINLGFKNIYVVGADHSWFKDIEIDDQNRMIRRDTHFYSVDKEIKPTPMFDPFTRKTVSMGKFMEAMQRVMNSYYFVQDYAKSRGARVINASSLSYIDAFERKSLPKSK